MKRFYLTSRVHNSEVVYTICDSMASPQQIIYSPSLEMATAAIDALNAIQEYEPPTRALTHSA